MAARRIDMHRLQDLVRYVRMGVGCRERARLLKMSPNTERKYRQALEKEKMLQGPEDSLPELDALRAAVLKHKPAPEPMQQTSSVESWIDDIERLVKKGNQATAIHDYLRTSLEEYTGTLSAMKRRVARLKKDKGISADEVAIPVETDPGEVAQVDFGYLGRLVDPAVGKERKAWVFVMVLGHSRHMYARVVFDQRQETWVALHIKAFEYFGGVVKTVVPDNLKAAVVRAAFGTDEPCGLNRTYRELARYYGFKVDPTPPRAPEKKGKVESAVKYVKRNFAGPRDFQDVHDANSQLGEWLVEVAGKRVHGTTGEQPLAAFTDHEAARLLPLPGQPYEVVAWKDAKVHTDSCITFDRKLYSVPWKIIGKQVWVRATASTVAVYYAEERVATHSRRTRNKRVIDDAHLPEHRVDYRYRQREYWEQRAAKMGPDVAAYVRDVFDADDVLSQLRTVQGIVRVLESVTPERARAASLRAGYYGNYSYGAVKNILRRGLDLQPLEANQKPGERRRTGYRFARTNKELFN
jgi:transposase